MDVEFKTAKDILAEEESKQNVEENNDASTSTLYHKLFSKWGTLVKAYIANEYQLPDEELQNFVNHFEKLKTTHLKEIKDEVKHAGTSNNPYKLKHIYTKLTQILIGAENITKGLEILKAPLTNNSNAGELIPVLDECIETYQKFPEIKRIERIQEIQMKKACKTYVTENLQLAKKSAINRIFPKVNRALHRVRQYFEYAYYPEFATDNMKKDFVKTYLRLNMQAFRSYARYKDIQNANHHLNLVKTFLENENFHKFVPNKYRTDNFIENAVERAGFQINY